MLKLKNVSKYYYQDGVIAEGFSKVNLELHMGEFVVITGESGSGKSTLLNVLSGLDTYEDGEMFINGEETSHYTEEDYLEYRRKYVSNIFQNFNLVNSYTVYENIELAMLMNGHNRKEVKKYINELIAKVGLEKYRKTKVSKLSGGQKQRVAIARALANGTPIIVADEPTGALDSKASKEILKLLAEISKDKLVIVVTHNKKEIEEYATRLIRMHDGKILENKVLNHVNLDDEAKPNEVKDITIRSKIRLGIRNAFNLPVKFILMFVIFLLITIALLSTYAALKELENEESMTSYNNYFYNYSEKRIVINKSDKSIVTDADIDSINKIEGVDFATNKDLLNEMWISFSRDDLQFDGLIQFKKEKVSIGRLPENDDEVVIKGDKNNWVLKERQDDLINREFTLDIINKKVTIVGIVFKESVYYDYNFSFILSPNLMSDLSLMSYNDATKQEFILNNNYFNEKGQMLYLKFSDKVPKGEIYIPDYLNNYCPNYNCLKKQLKVNVKNNYYEEKIEYKITKIYNKNNTKKLLGLNYDDLYYQIFINKEDYNYLFNHGDYQGSVFVKEIKDLDSVCKELHDLGYETLKLKDANRNGAEEVTQMFKIFRLVVSVILIVALFFISYFIIKVIYKSRNSYYTTLRSLGSTKKVCVNILMRELLCLATFSYVIFMLFIYLISKEVIKTKLFTTVIKYVNGWGYLVVFIILLAMSVLIAYRYGRKIFKESIIKTYGERI